METMFLKTTSWQNNPVLNHLSDRGGGGGGQQIIKRTDTEGQQGEGDYLATPGSVKHGVSDPSHVHAHVPTPLS